MEKVKILILAYYSYKDPVFQSAVLPYFLNFPRRQNFLFVLLTFEHQQYQFSANEIEEISNLLKENNIIWKRTTWRSGRFKALKKSVDFLSTVFYSAFLVKKYKLKAIYSEGLVGAILGYYASVLSGAKHIVHTFEPHADYMVEAGVWKESSWETKIVRRHELKIARQATLIFTATDDMIVKLAGTGIDRRKIFRVPSCVDLTHFVFDESAGTSVRNKFGIAPGDSVLVYLGKFGGMYMEDEAFRFFRIFQGQTQGWILIISQDDRAKISRLAGKHGLNDTRTISVSLTRKEIPGWLSAADVAFVAVRQFESKRFCSPIKTGEYLACGLPVIVPKGVSDDWSRLKELGIGIILDSPDENACLEAIDQWKTTIKIQNRVELRTKARDYVEGDRSIVHFKELYGQLFETL